MADEDPKNWIYAGGLPYELSEGDVICIFSQYGEILQFSLARDKETGKSRGFGFLKYEDPRSCELAVDNFNGTTIIGRKIKVSFANNTNAIKVSKSSVVAPTEDSALPIVESANRPRQKHKDPEHSPSESPDLKRRRSRHDSEDRLDVDRRHRDRKYQREDEQDVRRRANHKSESHRSHHRQEDSPLARRRERSADRHSDRRRRRSVSSSSSSAEQMSTSRHRHHKQSRHRSPEDSRDKDHRQKHSHRRKHSKKSHHRDRSRSVDRDRDRKSRVKHSERSPRTHERRHR